MADHRIKHQVLSLEVSSVEGTGSKEQKWIIGKENSSWNLQGKFLQTYILFDLETVSDI